MDAPPVQYARTSDGYDIAYTVAGEGTCILVPPFARSHAQLNWQNDLVLTRRIPFLSRLAEHFRVVTFDDRGQGLSSRHLPDDLSLDHFGQDMNAVAQAIADDRFTILGCARAAHLAVRYTIRHPQRVAALVLISCPISFQAWSSGLWDRLPKEHYDFFLQTQLLPGISSEDALKGVAFLRETVTPDAYQRAWTLWEMSDISDEVRQLNVPTLVLHPRAFALLPSEESVKLAASIPGASMSIIDGADFMGDANQGVAAIEDFLSKPLSQRVDGGHSGGATVVPSSILSPRELDVLRLIAAGRSNPQIAEQLVISVNTVQRHVSNILDKTGAANRTEAAGYARDKGLV